MNYIDPHIHMISRDHRRLPAHGLRAAASPSASRRSGPGSTAARADGFRDYFRQLTEVEPKRAAQFGIQHYSWLCINAKEAENVSLSREVIALIPEFLEAAERARHRRDRPQQEHRATRRPSSRSTSTWPMKTDELILIHTPHLEDKYKGTRMIVDMLKNDRAGQAAPRLHRPRRGAHGPARPRRRLLVRHDALPDDEMHAGAGRATSSRWSAPTASWPTRPATGASPTRWRCRS